jgi:hypothetical protein
MGGARVRNQQKQELRLTPLLRDRPGQAHVPHHCCKIGLGRGIAKRDMLKGFVHLATQTVHHSNAGHIDRSSFNAGHTDRMTKPSKTNFVFAPKRL